MKRFDLLVIGSGSAGTAAATAVRKAGRSVALAESRELGGTCMLRGCDPKKVLVEAARALDAVRRYRALGILLQAPAHDWSALARFKTTFTEPAPAERARVYDEAGIEVLHGEAVATGERTMRVGNDEIEADHIVIATGARTRHVAPGDDALLTSEDFLNLQQLPRSLVFVGGGYIAFEFAHVALRFGTEVTILNDGPSVLAGFDSTITARLQAFSESLGAAIHCNTKVERVERDAGGVVVTTSSTGGSRTFRAEAGVLAAGREPNLAPLALERMKVAYGKRGVTVNAQLQSTSNPHVYAAGDAVDDGGKPLTPVADAQGSVIARAILGDRDARFNARGLASIVYTIPPLATVGESEEAARARGIDVEVRERDMRTWYSTRSTASDAGFARTYVDRSNGALLGATIFGMHAEEQINVLAAALRADIPAHVLDETLFAYPTGSSDLGYIIGA